ncbi:hypothetical protein VSPL_50120 [Vibrio splendidus]|uniref:hypothetical protein n=2 Tax=Vibrio splendidus TaxID=29497 RepID=UPI000ACC9A7D|nr:hypothetical protein [Vibrio splendidus]PHX03573.1 hypothetical protein VSPL_50120 [Vibrio splendidus]
MMFRFYFFILSLISTGVLATEAERSYINHSTALFNEVQLIKSDVERLKLNNGNLVIKSGVDSELARKVIRLELMLDDLESQIYENGSTTELSVIKENLFSRIDSSDESIANWGVIFGLLGTGWGVLITLITIYIGYLNNKKADDVVRLCTEQVDHWIEFNAPRILKDGSESYIEEIKKMRDEAERYLLYYQQDHNEGRKASEYNLKDEFTDPVSERVNEVIKFYQQQDFAEAILKAKFILDGTVTIRDKIELLQIVSYAYNAIGRPDLADEYNVELLRVINNSSQTISAFNRANILFKISMNKYSMNRKSYTPEVLRHLNDLISEFLNYTDIRIVRIVAQARMLKAIINENSGYYASAKDQYKEIITSYQNRNDEELSEVVEKCRSNLRDLNESDS